MVLLRHAFQYLLFLKFTFIARIIPVHASQFLGRLTGYALFYLVKKERNICLYQLGVAFPEMEEAERWQVTKSAYAQMGMTLWELLAIPRIRREADRWVKWEGEEALRAAYEEKRGVVAVTAHTGNWELFTVLFGMVEIPAQAVVRSLYNSLINNVLVANRESPFMKMIQRGSKASPRQLLTCLKNGDVLVLALDQDTRTQSVFVDFFGVPAATPRVAASLALKGGVPIVTALDRRLADGSHVFSFERIEVPKDFCPCAAHEIELTQMLTHAIEKHIRAFPDQWAWNHRRWKKRPTEETP